MLLLPEPLIYIIYLYRSKSLSMAILALESRFLSVDFIAQIVLVLTKNYKRRCTNKNNPPHRQYTCGITKYVQIDQQNTVL